jgi:hypothetical protein
MNDDALRAMLIEHDSGATQCQHDGTLCCLDAAHSYGASLRKMLGLPVPATRPVWGPSGIVAKHPVTPWTWGQQ